jgi:competence protein ComGD
MRKILDRRAVLQIRAFTLLESLLVLLISSFVLLLFAGSMTKVVHLARGALFMARFENNYKSTQFLATATTQPQQIAINKGKLTYASRTLSVPSEVEVADFTVKFDRSGNNSSLQKLKFYLPEMKQTIIYQLEIGSGKYRKTVH